ncbi:FAD-binding oxidoreductase [Kribbella shirazensis]|uniref:Ferredoxin-NADP reductase n=1 Tax=Kribbella shirazensis TaxID=1105143 RepID=A0A7X5VHX5_9ACTN|nr:FAD-binding oxidoreductase [Kribbella shirazensis]NIK61379.1 ferredoxin-NADP reductase [Kribbella shirazensis]
MARLTWQRATVVGVLDETATARTLTLEIDAWSAHRPGQHVDVRLTASDGYTAVRPYSIATPPNGSRIDLTVGLADNGEVSSYLVAGAGIGTELEVRGPLGGWFIWDRDDPAPVQLVGAGVGVAPLMAVLRAHDSVTGRGPMRLLYSSRSPETLLYATELAGRTRSQNPTSAVTVLYTRAAPGADPRPPGRITTADIVAHGLPPVAGTRCYVCGSTGFVEAAIELVIEAGFAADNIRAERFG